MIKKIKSYFMNNNVMLFALLIFLFFLTIFCFSPISSDDWGNYVVGIKGVREWIDHSISMYFAWEGRFASRLLINAFTYNKWLWNILTALSMSLLYILTIKLIKPKKVTLISIAFILSILLIGGEIFLQTYLWLAGNITYFIPLVLIFIYLYMISHYVSKTILNKWYVYTLWLILNLIIPMFVENMGALIVIINVIMLGYILITNKRFDKLFFVSLIISLISFLTMIMSPGTIARIAYESSLSNEVSFFERIFINLPNFIEYTITGNNLLLLIFPISYIYLAFRKIKNLYLRILVIILNILPFLTFIFNIANTLFMINISLLEFIRYPNFFMIIIWLFYLISFFILLIINFKNKQLVIFFFILAIVSNGVMLVSPLWGARTALFTVFMLLIVNLFVLSEIVSNLKQTHIFEILGEFFLGIIMIVLVILYYNVYLQNKERGKSIAMQVTNNSDIIEIESIPPYTLWDIDPYDDYHIETFKEYYHIPSDKKIVIKPYKYKYFIFYK
jgi:hypothetical protein